MDVFSALGAAASSAYNPVGSSDPGASFPAAATPPGAAHSPGTASVTGTGSSDSTADVLSPEIADAPSPSPSAREAGLAQLPPDIRYAPSTAPRLAGFDRSA